jgi:homoprotocatechuate degradation regulator HpaR
MSTALRHRNLPHLLLRSRETLMAHFRPLLTAQGLTDPQWRILRELAEQGSLEPRQLCEACSISSPSIAGVLLRMEEAGLVSRERMKSDQRRVAVTLRPKSRRILRRLVPLIEERYGALESALGMRSMQEVYDAVDALLLRTPKFNESAGDDVTEPRAKTMARGRSAG